MLRLVRPSVKYKASFLKALKEFHKEGRLQEYIYNDLANNFFDFVGRTKAKAVGKNLQPGYVPETVYWLVSKNKYLGKVSVRHYLNKHLRKEGGHIGYAIRPSSRRKGYGTKILELVLPKARKLGIKKALLTCDADNIGSKKIIIANGGAFQNKIKSSNGKSKLRFWINLGNN